MKGKIIEAKRIKRPNSVSSIESTQLTWEEAGERITESYKLIRGSVVWPHESFPGVVLLGGQPSDSEKVIILEEKLFDDMASAIEVFGELAAYSPSLYYYREDVESEGFVSFLRRAEKLRGKIPLVPAHHPDAADYGIQLVGTFLEDDRLIVPPNSILATQLQEGRHDTPVEEVYALTALRYLLAGINEYPWEKEITEMDIHQCFS
jgi:hypothetical protein